MAITPIRIPHLSQAQPIVDSEGRPSNEFLRRLNDIFQTLADAITALQQLPLIQQALEDAQQAATDAQAAAVAAQSAADSAQGDAMANAREQALVNSTIDPISVLSATPTTITIAPHVRKYADGTSVSVPGGTVPATATGETDYVSYIDANRDGAFASYEVETDPPAQGMDRHVVGAVTIPATGTQNGGSGPRAPGYVQP